MTDCKNPNVSIPIDATTLSEKFATAKREVRALSQELARMREQAPDRGAGLSAELREGAGLAAELREGLRALGREVTEVAHNVVELLAAQEEAYHRRYLASAGQAYVAMLRDGDVDPDMQEKLAELEQHRRQQ